MARPALATILGLALVAAGCGGGDGERPRSANEVVDAGAEPPYVGSLDVNPKDGSLLLGTNAGTFRVGRGSDRIERIEVRVEARGRTTPVDKGLVFAFTGPDELVGSGHPGPGAAVSPLGLIRSSDGGRSWRSVSLLGRADLHAVAQRGREVVASDGSQAFVGFSTDGGRSFRARSTPMLLADMEASPDEASRLVGSSESGVHTSDDGGRTWRPRDPEVGVRFAWPERRSLFRVSAAGAVKRSADSGRTWKEVGKAPGEPHALAAAGPRRLYVADVEGVIHGSRDGGRTWTVRARP